MKPDFSEFSYGFAFTHEYVNRNPGLTAAPELPSLIREAERGYDLKLNYSGHPKFFQFKLSEYLKRENAIHWHHHREPHYRVRVATCVGPGRAYGTDQHSRLKHLAEKVDHVNYVAPKFHSETEFNNLFRRGEVTTNSIWAPVKDLPAATDNRIHYMTFTRTQAQPLWHSEALRLEGRFTAEEHYEAIKERVTIDEDYFRGLRSKLLVALDESGIMGDEHRNANDDNDDIASVLRHTYRLLTAQFGLQMVTLIEKSG